MSGWTFFVLSGFFISTIIIDDTVGNQFSLRRFYELRARRILPLVVIALIVFTVMAFYSLPSELWVRFKHQLLSSVAFVMNFCAMIQMKSFGWAALEYPLTHLWSLAIEEQFYLFWPIILSFAARRQVTLLICVMLAAVSGIAAFLSMNNFPVFYFSTLSRVWEFMAGGIVAHNMIKIRSSRIHETQASWVSEILSFTALMWLVLVTLLLSEIRNQGGMTFGAVLATCILLRYLPGTLMARVLSNPVLINLGLTCYSFYIWHWPFVFRS